MPKNPYGYDHKQLRPWRELQRLLKLDNNVGSYRSVQTDIYRVAKTHLNLAKTCSEQKEALHAISNELKELYPDVFDDEESDKRLYVVRRGVLDYHSGRRWAMVSKRRKASSQNIPAPTHSSTSSRNSCASKENTILDIEPDSSGSQDYHGKIPTKSQPSQPLVERMALNLASVAQNSAPTRIFAPRLPGQLISQEGSDAFSKNPSTNPVSLEAPSSTYKQTSDGPFVLIPPYPSHGFNRFKLPLSSNPQASSSNLSIQSSDLDQSIGQSQNISSQVPSATSPPFLSSPPIADPKNLPRGPHNQLSRISRFLNTCVPPMTHYLQRFVDFGCVNDEFLLGISMLPRDKIEEDFLKRLPPGPAGEPMTAMECVILKNHFEQYFK